MSVVSSWLKNQTTGLHTEKPLFNSQKSTLAYAIKASRSFSSPCLENTQHIRCNQHGRGRWTKPIEQLVRKLITLQSIRVLDRVYDYLLHRDTRSQVEVTKFINSQSQSIIVVSKRCFYRKNMVHELRKFKILYVQRNREWQVQNWDMTKKN